eukprot:6754486-Pyramimonas_sp.AAC.1
MGEPTPEPKGGGGSREGFRSEAQSNRPTGRVKLRRGWGPPAGLHEGRGSRRGGLAREISTFRAPGARASEDGSD